MSTFLIVVQGCHANDNNSVHVLNLLRNALVHRYRQLQLQLSEDDNDQEIREVLMVLREDIRTSEDTFKFPGWCAIWGNFSFSSICFQL